MFMTGSYEFLSNFFRCDVMFLTVDGHLVTAKSLEHAFQAMKTKILREQMIVLAQATPGLAKRKGWKVTLREDWDEVKLDIMLHLLYSKFADYRLLTKLVAVDETIIEHNRWHDNYWGQCVCSRCQLKPNSNWLGILLTEVQNHDYRRYGTQGHLPRD
ncbi:MAG: NADAR family protein [Desulfobacterales bacterium]|nr:NADAR family protein [Desulfobacterales bacterium]